MRRIALAAAAAAALFGVVPAAQASRLSAHDKEYLKMSAQGDIFEIYGGRMALRHSHNGTVRHLARVLVRDHLKSLRDTRALAARHGMTLPTSATPPEQWELAVVDTYSGRKFNKWYTSLEINDHKQDIEDASDEAENGLNPAVRKGARDELPMLERHLVLSRIAWRAS